MKIIKPKHKEKIMFIEKFIEKRYGRYVDISESETIMIKTNKSIYYFRIDTYQQCCETFGYFVADNLNYYSNADLYKIEIIENADIRNIDIDIDADSSCVVLIKVHTSKGVLDIYVYNEHNGFYGHDIVIEKVSETVKYVV